MNWGVHVNWDVHVAYYYLSAELCVLSGCVQKPVVLSSVPLHTVAEVTVAKANIQTVASDVNRTLVTDNISFVSGATELSGIQPQSVPQISSASSHSSCNDKPLQPTGENQLSVMNDALDSYASCSSPPPNDCLNDIWLSSAVVDSGSPLIPRSCNSCSSVGLHECVNILTREANWPLCIQHSELRGDDALQGHYM